MWLFDGLVGELATNLNVGPKAAPLIGELLAVITGGQGGVGGFIERLRASNLGVEAGGWLGAANPDPAAAPVVERAIGAPALAGMAQRLGLAAPVVTAAAGYALPRLVGLLTPGGSVPVAIPPAVTTFMSAFGPGTAVPRAPIPAPVAAATAAPAVAPVAAAPIVPAAPPARPVAPKPAAMPLRSAPSAPAPLPVMDEPEERRRPGILWAVPLLFLGLVTAATYWLYYADPALGPYAGSAKPAPPAPAPAVTAAPAAPAPVAAAAPAAEPAPAPAPAFVAAPAPAPVAAPPVAPAPAPSARLLVTNNNGEITFGGRVRDGATRDSVLAALKTAFGPTRLRGDVAVDPTRAEATWLPHLGAALGDLKVPGVRALFDGPAVGLGGAVPQSELASLIARLRALFGAGATVGTLSADPGGLAAATADQALFALSGLKSGYSARDVAAVLNATIVNFATGDAGIPDDDVDVLRQAAARLRALPKDSVIEIAGYTDNTGDAATNLALSQRRADAVRARLIEDGADAATLTAHGYGAASPAAPNDTEEGRFRNRRIEYHVTR